LHRHFDIHGDVQKQATSEVILEPGQENKEPLGIAVGILRQPNIKYEGNL
jgi:hypothetical protein